MKSLFTSLLLAIGLASSAFAGDQTVTLDVEKMHCALCPITVQKAIEKVEGVANVEVDYETKTAVVTFDDKATSWRALAAASTNAGYPATLRSE